MYNLLFTIFTLFVSALLHIYTLRVDKVGLRDLSKDIFQF